MKAADLRIGDVVRFPSCNCWHKVTDLEVNVSKSHTTIVYLFLENGNERGLKYTDWVDVRRGGES